MANALNHHEHLPQRFTPAIVRRDAFGRRGRFHVLVAEADHHVVGYASIIAGYNTDTAAPELWMLDLFVVRAWRRRGVGRALVTAVAREAGRRGVTSLGWGVRGSNTGARHFYRRLGARLSSVRIASLSGSRLMQVAAGR